MRSKTVCNFSENSRQHSMRKHASCFSALFLELCLICNYVVFRNLFQPEILEDVEECGILGSKENTPTLPASRQANANRNLTPYEDEDTIQECLWDCDWQPNPYYKKSLLWLTKQLEFSLTADNTVWSLISSPQE